MRAAKVDANQKKLVEQIRKLPGVTVAHTHTVGKGFPDIIIGFRGQSFLVELKNPDQPKSKRKLTADEERWHQQWTGQVAVAETLEDIISLLKLK